MYEQIAKRIVEESLSISEEDSVVISAWEHTLEFASAISIEAQKTGADVIITTFTDEIYLRTMTELPDELLRKPQKLSISMLDTQTVNIGISGPKDPTILEKMPKEKFGILGESAIPYNKKFIERKIRSVEIQLGLVTPQRAKTYGLDYDSWMNEMTNSLDVSPSKLKNLGIKVAEKLEKAQEVYVTAPGGTDVKFNTTGRTAHIFDGVVDPEDIKKGTHFGSLPVGSVFIAPLETSAMGKVVSDLPSALVAKWIKGLEWTFENGLLINRDAKENFELWDKFFGGGTGNKDRIAAFGIGMNPKAKTGFLHDFIVKGVVTIGIGDNKFLRGANDASIADNMSISNATVKLDGESILKNGEFQI